ncbi:hypothetical protein HG536_0A04230 [Torulaspora globosa]|uniref:Splicing factor YJU2 n=1 Tax=Torulaspora globosa TaxID=48254 RepID=A0A7G3ZAR9_9SACH|nr:uncharacterized protein HG536_0A04230 [Torulaspora globosa]QLL30605.1 hypothetical protein HG536_0A04230 [Torulaspora globosa]
MSERKAVNKYYPPDFNPLEAEASLRKSAKKLKTKQRDVITIRLMTPFSIRCTKCSEYIAKSRKFNGKKEVLPERYLETIKIYRLSIKCPRCNNMISFRTDPKTSDFVMECGGVRNYSRVKDEDSRVESVDETLQRLVQETNESESERLSGKGEDKMEALERRLAQIQREQEDDQELERTRLSRLSMQQREQRLRDRNAAAVEENEQDLDKIAEEAFNRRQDHGERLNAPFRKPQPKALIFKKRSKKVNPLGVIKKAAGP